MFGTRHLLPISIVLLLVATSVVPAGAQTPSASVVDREYPIKAAFLYHFSTYIEWPAEAFPAEGEPFVIGVFGSDPFGSALDQIAATKNVSGHPIDVRQLASVSNVRGCHIVFVPRSASATERDALLKNVNGLPVLVVGETDDFVERGGHAQFFVEENRVRFAFSADVAKRDDLKISSRLLSLAKIIPSK